MCPICPLQERLVVKNLGFVFSGADDMEVGVAPPLGHRVVWGDAGAVWVWDAGWTGRSSGVHTGGSVARSCLLSLLLLSSFLLPLTPFVPHWPPSTVLHLLPHVAVHAMVAVVEHCRMM